MDSICSQFVCNNCMWCCIRFHSLVSSGTASKQIKMKRTCSLYLRCNVHGKYACCNRTDRSCIFREWEAAAQGLTTQPQIFAGAIANFLEVIGLPHSLVFTLINLAVSAFALTSLDSVARVGRLSFRNSLSMMTQIG